MKEMLDRIRLAEQEADAQVAAVEMAARETVERAQEDARVRQQEAKDEGARMIREGLCEARETAAMERDRIFKAGQSQREQLRVQAEKRQPEAIRQAFAYVLGCDPEKLT